MALFRLCSLREKSSPPIWGAVAIATVTVPFFLLCGLIGSPVIALLSFLVANLALLWIALWF